MTEQAIAFAVAGVLATSQLALGVTLAVLLRRTKQTALTLEALLELAKAVRRRRM